MRTLATVLALLTLLAGAASAQSLKGIRKEFARIGDEVIPATVTLRSPTIPRPTSTGVIIHPKGYILSDADATSLRPGKDADGNPVKRHGRDAIVRLPAPDLREFRAVVVLRDPETDSTLLKIVDPIKGKLPYVRLGFSDPLKVGDFTVVVGNMFGSGTEGEPALSMGSISALLKRAAPTGGRNETIYTSAAVNPGSNGGPCVNAEGRLVGIVSTWERDPESPFRALGIVTPIDKIRAKYVDVEDFDLVFPDPKEMKPRSDEAGVVENAFSAVAHYVYPSLVSLEVVRAEGTKTTMTFRNPRFRGPATPNEPPTYEVPRYPGPYSAVALSTGGYLLTCTANLWEYGKIESVTAHLHDGRSLEAKLVARDRYRAIALLKVEADDLLPLEPAKTADFKVGRFALALANPFGKKRQEAPLFTFGIVSGLHRLSKEMDAVQSDAGMVDGMVGGALVTLEGKLLGVCLLANPEAYGRNSGIGFAIPMSALEESLPTMMEGTSVEPGFMGVRFDPKFTDKVVLLQITPKSPAAEAGLKAKDRVLEANGQRVGDIPALQAILRGRVPGDVIELKIARSDGEHRLSVTLGSRPGD